MVKRTVAYSPFKAALRAVRLSPSPPPVAPPPPEPEFRQLFADVVPLAVELRVQHPSPRPSPHPRQRPVHSPIPASHAEMAHAFDYFDAETVPPHFLRTGIQHQVLRKLRAGHWPVVAEIDLHGASRHQAEERLLTFLFLAQQRGQAVRVIHGLGMGSAAGAPVLKPLVRQWLSRHPEVLAFCEDAGGGAVLVLLRRRRQTD